MWATRPRLQVAIGGKTIVKTLVLTLSVLALATVGCRTPSDSLIVPGKRVGNIVLGRTTAGEVDGDDGHPLPEFEGRGLSFGFDSHSRIGAIDVFKPTYKTKEGIGVGDSEQRVVAVYGVAEVVEVPLMAGTVRKGTFAKRALHYPGIRWLINSKGTVEIIIVSAD